MTTVARLDDRLQVFTDFTQADRCRHVLGGKWNKRAGCWEYPLPALPFVMEAFPHANFDAATLLLIEKYNKREAKIAALRGGTEEPRCHDFLMRHQRLCRDIAMYMPRYGLMLDTGTGKTLTAYAIMQDKLLLRWLVICPKSIVKAAWMEDHLNFYPHLRVLPMSKNVKPAEYLEIAERWGIRVKKATAAQMQDALLPFADVVLINPESFKMDMRVHFWEHQGLIVDESSILRNGKTATTKAVVEHSRSMRNVYLMSGKPAPNNELEYFPQMQIINPALLGDSFFRFRERFFAQTDYLGYNYSMRESMRPEFTRRLSMGCIFLRKEDCLDLPPEMPPVIRKIELSKEAMRYYKEMERNQVVYLEDRAVAATTKLAGLMKLRQITSGFIIDTKEEGEVAPLHNDKRNELEAVLTELGDNKAVIWVNFRREVKEISALLDSMGRSYVTAYSETKDVDASIEAFKKDEAQYIIAHPQTLKYGVTFTGPSMVRNCTYAIYYSMSYSFEDYYQSHDRIYRKGQTESCTYIFLVAEDTVDEDIYNAIIRKGNNAEVIENMVRRCKHEPTSRGRKPAGEAVRDAVPAGGPGDRGSSGSDDGTARAPGCDEGGAERLQGQQATITTGSGGQNSKR